jgi:hypothetical protein
MQCNLSAILMIPIVVFVGFYVVLIVMSVLVVINGQQERNKRIRAEEKKLGITPSFITEYLRDNQSLQDGVMGAFPILKNIFSRTMAIFVGVIAVIALLVGTWQMCVVG